ncbi:Centromere-binding protein 1 OS=Kluyveromyces lactis (strain ATCC 8585 / CBS 2359 / DSM 70799 / NBRC 1267 / NRRL Y-1140 / WM37) GN=CBF1 PE=3 SV=2 [Rhizoctonia solani AG-1 IB]|uniref:Centromere-binding protein 1 n=1 Tax=Thanatephorus cucumeris (strain AG1-IB / isolate 7/3/14) TaxID=1108050 RepID=A0A0B7FXH7_THACB|nr:Centromere-binding protein 1 OS=Kluyveromyces lactis (strain ATCC 8585 / CBS 2359 / DSM 70799 / NBRC 1267 / NRRL Y-1140 / WM37) GN=CBF1 PE=3 SV=2 [Rhizoctonia solani AG-1 IB]
MTAATTASAAPGTPDKMSRSPSPDSHRFKLRPAESTSDAQAAAGSDSANPDAATSVSQADAEANATPQDIFLMLNAVQQLHEQGQQNQGNPGAAPHSDATEGATPGSPAQRGTSAPLPDLQLDPALMGPGVPAGQQQPGVPPQQQHLSQQSHIPHPHHPHIHHQPPLIYHHPPPQYIPSGYVPPGGHTMPPPPELQQLPQQPYEDDGEDGDNSATFLDPNGQASSGPAEEAAPAQPASGGKKGGKWAAQDTLDWQRKRKDNHKEVERRRRSNINEGINELARIVPNVGAEKAKGAILSRSVQYIHDLKENEARNIEKWTLEKLLMDQAMGDLQAQLDEMRQRLDEERQKREQVEAQLAEVLRVQQERGGEEPTAKRARVE